MTEELKPIQGLENGEGVSTPSEKVVETPASGGVSNETPTPAQPVDVDELRAKYENDIRQMKSSLQRREAQVKAEMQKQYETLQKQLHETRMKGMTEEERKSYEAQLQTEEYQRLQSRLTEMEQERQTQAATWDAYQAYLQQGVPASAMNLSEGYEAVVQAGWNYLAEELTRLRELAKNPPQSAKSEPAPLKQAPGVVTDKGTPASGTTWAALRSQGWSDEAIYRAVESGRLPASIIPTE